MKVVDLTHIINEEMPVYPGTESPKIIEANTIEIDGFAEKIVNFVSHTGTHIDAPCHVFKDKKSLDEFDIDKFVGRGLVIDVLDVNSIEVALLESHEEEINEVDFVLFRSGWDRYWGSEDYFKGFPALTKEAARWIGEKSLKGIGIDAISLDKIEDEDLPNHKLLLDKELIFTENLKGLDRLIGCKFLFSCLPLRLEKADGSPVRAIGII